MEHLRTTDYDMLVADLRSEVGEWCDQALGTCTICLSHTSSDLCRQIPDSPNSVPCDIALLLHVQAVASVAADRMQKRSLNTGHILAPIPPMHSGGPIGQEGHDPHDRGRFLQLDTAAQTHPAFPGSEPSPSPQGAANVLECLQE